MFNFFLFKNAYPEVISNPRSHDFQSTILPMLLFSHMNMRQIISNRCYKGKSFVAKENLLWKTGICCSNGQSQFNVLMKTDSEIKWWQVRNQKFIFLNWLNLYKSVSSGIFHSVQETQLSYARNSYFNNYGTSLDCIKTRLHYLSLVAGC